MPPPFFLSRSLSLAIFLLSPFFDVSLPHVPSLFLSCSFLLPPLPSLSLVLTLSLSLPLSTGAMKEIWPELSFEIYDVYRNFDLEIDLA